MKRPIIILLLGLLIFSCSPDKTQSIDDLVESKDLELIRQRKDELDADFKELEAQIKKLENSINELSPERKIPNITTFVAESEIFNHFVELQGSVSTKRNLVLYPEYSGILTSVLVTEGQKVRKGQILARIDDGGLSQQLAQLQIQTDLAKTTYERQKRLWEQNIGSEIQFLQAKSNYEAQERAVQQLQQQIAKTAVRAPFSGTIDDVITEQGSVVAPGQTPLIRIVNLDDMYIETDVPERYISNVVKGKKVEVEFPILGKNMTAEVRQAGNFINPANRTFKVEIGVPNSNGEIKPNLTAKLRINDYTNDKAILIPQSIISENAEGEQYVFTVNRTEDNKAIANRIIIETGKTQGDMVEILSGLKNGDTIIDEGARSVKDKQSVRILNGIAFNQ